MEIVRIAKAMEIIAKSLLHATQIANMKTGECKQDHGKGSKFKNSIFAQERYI